VSDEIQSSTSEESPASRSVVEQQIFFDIRCEIYDAVSTQNKVILKQYEENTEVRCNLCGSYIEVNVQSIQKLSDTRFSLFFKWFIFTILTYVTLRLQFLPEFWFILFESMFFLILVPDYPLLQFIVISAGIIGISEIFGLFLTYDRLILWVSFVIGAGFMGAYKYLRLQAITITTNSDHKITNCKSLPDTDLNQSLDDYF